MDERAPRARWYRQPVSWLGALIFVASLAGCALLIALASRHPDPPVPTVGFQLLKVPVGRVPESNRQQTAR